MSDEIHYINDVERGTVWEETLMHLPSSVQMVALSATLRDPELFVAWIAKARCRAGRIVRRIDRHVPLHLGALERRSGGLQPHVPSLQPHVPSLQPYVRPGLSEMFAEQKRRACLLVRAC